MIIVIDASLIDAIGSDSDIVSALDLIAHSRRLGNHIVFGNRKVIKFLANCELISPQSQAVYRKLYEKLSTSKAYLDKIGFFVRVVAENVLEQSFEDNYGVIRASFKYFADISINDKTILLSEDLDDISFYRKLSEAYISWNNLGNVYIQHEPRNGGGLNTARTFEHLQSQKRKLCLCLLDSDIKASGLSYGDTARAVEKVNDENAPFCQYIILRSGEVENLIPASVYKEVFCDDSHKSRAICFFEELDNSELSEVRKYVDFKEGIKLFDILKQEPQKLIRIYWLEFAEKKDFSVDEECLKNKKCLLDKKNCSCYITPPLGTKIIAKFNQKYLNQDVSHLIPDSMKSEWEEIGRIITAWCCASSRIS